MKRVWRNLVAAAAVLMAAAAAPGAAVAARPAPVVFAGSLLLGSWIPVPALDRALTVAGWGATWNPAHRTWSLRTPTGLHWRRPAHAVPAAKDRAFRVLVDGVAIGSLPPMAMVDPVTGTSVPYLTLDAVQAVLAPVGITAAWAPARWLLRGTGATTRAGGSAATRAPAPPGRRPRPAARSATRVCGRFWPSSGARKGHASGGRWATPRSVSPGSPCPTRKRGLGP